MDYVITDLYNDTTLGNRLQDVIVVLPTRRAGAFLKQALGHLAGNKPVCSPQVTTISDLIDELCPYRTADEIEAVCLLYQVYKELIPDNKLEIDTFYGWGRQLIEDFNNVDKSGEITKEGNIDPNKTHEILAFARDARKFDETGIDKEVKNRIQRLISMLSTKKKGDSTENSTDNVENGAEKTDINADTAETEEKTHSVRKELERLWRLLPDIYDALTKRLEEKHAMLEGAKNKWVVEHFDDVVNSKLKGKILVFAGFNYLLPVEIALMMKLKNADMARFYWDYDPVFAEQEHDTIPVYKHIKENINILGGKYEEGKNPVDSDNTTENDKKEVDLFSAQSDNAQAHYITDWLNNTQNNAQTTDQSTQTTAIVLCNEQMLESAIFSVPSSLSGEVNITKGFPMRNTPVYAQINQLLGKYAKSNICPADVIQKVMELINDNRETLRKNGFPNATEDTDAFTWHQLLQAESLFQALQVAKSFGEILKDGLLPNDIPLHTLRNLLMRHLSTVSIPFHGEPITNIQIIGMLETRALDFDNLLLLNVEEGTLPRTSIDRSFIPYYIRKYYKIPTSDEDTDIYAYNFFRLLRRAKNISIVYSEAQSAEGQKQMSRFVMQMLCSPHFNCHRYLLSDSNELPATPESELHDKLLQLSLPCKNYVDKILSRNTEQETDTPTAQPASPSLSPSAINTYIECKMKFFIRYMLGVNKPDSEDALWQANELGSLIHGALQAIYNKIKDSETKQVTPEAIYNFLDGKFPKDKFPKFNLADAIQESVNKMNEDYKKFHKNTGNATQYSIDKHKIEVAVAETHIKKVLNNDARNGSFTLIDTERDTYLTIDDIPNLGSLRIGGSIDRLDVVSEDGKQVLRIIDYKTGKYDKNKMKTTHIADLFNTDKTKYVLQTFIYSLACLKDNPTNPQSPNLNEKIKKKEWIVSPRLLFTQKDLNQFDPHIYINEDKVTDFENQAAPAPQQTGNQNNSGAPATISKEFEDALTDFVKNDLLKETDFPMTTNTGDKSPCKYCPYKQLCGRTQIAPL